jgi:hypothetical protein
VTGCDYRTGSKRCSHPKTELVDGRPLCEHHRLVVLQARESRRIADQRREDEKPPRLCW